MDLQLPPTPPMDLSDNSNDYKVSFEKEKIVKSAKRKSCWNANALSHVSADFIAAKPEVLGETFALIYEMINATIFSLSCGKGNKNSRHLKISKARKT